jgi:hypothetical protein
VHVLGLSNNGVRFRIPPPNFEYIFVFERKLIDKTTFKCVEN